MADYKEYERGATRANIHTDIDEGLRSYMLSIYNYMATAIGVTGVAAFSMATWSTNNPTVANALYNSPLKWVIMLAPLCFIMVISFGIDKLSRPAATMAFYAFSAVMGISMSWIFMVFNIPSIVQTFFITAASFASLSLYGYTTERSLSGIGSFLIMGLLGLIIASLINLLMPSGALGFAINVIGVLIFAGLTAYDTQRLKYMYNSIAGNSELIAKSSILGALSLYLSFVNMFMFLLQLIGNRD
ncbi:Bax inhibitor-1/YccA family protein [Candidatus Endowatersipora endosymbiont of Watersipora subatra]|uniref:Bax inhibitor-1/YccA family protein n=1 Tax=Candidatus Endowatersipora endosymbiont of Watersipora subatra TaxID=3077946 RepID=UPI00312C8B22